jgi:hypothetical protein
MCGLPAIDPAAAATNAPIDPTTPAASIDPSSGSIDPTSAIDPTTATNYSSSI